ncbi:hypothetical protein [Streptomyces sp. Agncl-13]|uniref:hypothetical protein n=1 Tax=Streptomyces sp. Agncl-13 TaxID=3400628 RepID=UPI003A8C42BD
MLEDAGPLPGGAPRSTGFNNIDLDERLGITVARVSYYSPYSVAESDLVTSHQAYYTQDAVAQIIDATLQNVLDYTAGRRSENVLVPRN